MSRRLLPITAAALTAVLALSSCTSGGGDGKKGVGFGKKAAAEPTVQVDNAKNDKVTAGKKLKLSVTDGKFSNVEITDTDDKSVTADAGKFTTPKTKKATAGATSTAKSTAGAGGLVGSDDDESSATPSATASSTTDAPAATTDSGSNSEGAASTDASSGAASASDSASTAPTAKTKGNSSTNWTSNYRLSGNSSYTWKATTIDADGNDHEATGTVKTTSPKGDTSKITPMIRQNQKVGVGAPIIVYFNVVVPDKYKASIEHRLSVKATDKEGNTRNVEGTWAWLPVEDGISRLHYRTKEYWPAHSNVRVDMPLKGMQFNQNLYGNKDTTLKFKVARKQTAVGNAKTHRFTVTRDGKKKWNWPASLGSPNSPSYNGVHVVMSKDSYYVMRSERYNYETPTHWAVRIQNNGEFVHAAPWSEGSQGNSNVSHGCINLSMTNAKKYYDSALYGDPVTIKGSGVSLSKDSSDINDWVYSWKSYKKMSAL